MENQILRLQQASPTHLVIPNFEQQQNTIHISQEALHGILELNPYLSLGKSKHGILSNLLEAIGLYQLYVSPNRPNLTFDNKFRQAGFEDAIERRPQSFDIVYPLFRDHRNYRESYTQGYLEGKWLLNKI